MSTKNCKVDVVSISFKQFDDVELKMTFKDVLLHPEILNQEKYINSKTVHYSLLEENEKYIVGFIRTTLDKDLPAKINKKTKEISELNVGENEGLAFGNIFIYSIELNCLFYEVNKNSVYLNIFKDFLYRCYKESETLKDKTSFTFHFGTIYRKREYERAISMKYYKSFILKVHQPAELLNSIKQVNRTLEDKIENDFLPQLTQAAELNSEIAEIEFNVTRPKKTGGLYREKMLPILESLRNLLGYSEIREHIEKVEICGYSTDTEQKTPINLLGDIYFATFKVPVPRLDSTLQKKERKENIIKLYEKEYPILKNYI